MPEGQSVPNSGHTRLDTMRAAVFGSVALTGLIALFVLPTSSGIFSVISGLVTGAALLITESLLQNARWLRVGWYSVRYRNQRVRMSIAYLYRIKLEDKYMLIKGKRFDSYIPVGGVYKFSPSALETLDKLKVLTDDLVPVDVASKNDLRVRVPGKNLIGFLRWFESGEARETSPWREFWEELVQDGIVSSAAFPWIFERRIRRHFQPIRFSDFAQCMELQIADIYELQPTVEQANELEALRERGHPSILWANEEQIRRRGALPGQKQEYTIGAPAEWAL